MPDGKIQKNAAACALPGREPKWLDQHLSERLSKHYRMPLHADSAMLPVALRAWQWEHLGRTLLAAASFSPRYKAAIGRAAAAGLIERCANEAGLDPALARSVAPAHDNPAPALALSPVLQAAPASARTACPHTHIAALDSALAALLAALPFTCPHELAEASEDFLGVSQGEVEGLIFLPSSGTTGPGKRIYCTAEDLEETAAFFHHGMQYLVRPAPAPYSRADSVALLMSGGRPGSVGDLLARGLAGLGVACSVPGFIRPETGGPAGMIDNLLRLAPTCLVGVPGQLLALARHERAKELAPLIRTVLLSGDAVTPELRQGIAAGLGCAVFVHYGLTETGLGGAVECSLRQGCHLREADMLAEIVDERGRALPRGQWGEIVLTTLTRRAMPLLRYRTGDEGRLAAAACGCGSVFPLLEVRGRMAERLALPGGGHLHSTELDRALYALPWLRAYTATLHEAAPGRAACLSLVMELTPDAPEQAAGHMAAALDSLEGLRVIRRAEELAADDPRLATHIGLTAGQGGQTGQAGRNGQTGQGGAAQTQAKRSICRTAEPCSLLPPAPAQAQGSS